MLAVVRMFAEIILYCFYSLRFIVYIRARRGPLTGWLYVADSVCRQPPIWGSSSSQPTAQAQWLFLGCYRPPDLAGSSISGQSSSVQGVQGGAAPALSLEAGLSVLLQAGVGRRRGGMAKEQGAKKRAKTTTLAATRTGGHAVRAWVSFSLNLGAGGQPTSGGT